MRKNEYTSLDEFKKQYTGIWEPSAGHWFGLDFSYHGIEYRFNTGAMYKPEDTILPDGRVALFGLYRKDPNVRSACEYSLISEFATMDDALKSTCIEGIPFAEIITDSDTELLGQD